MQCTYKRKDEKFLCKQCCSGKIIRITCSEFVLWPYFSSVQSHAHHLWAARLYNILYYLIKGKTFRKNVIGYKMCVLSFSTNLSEIFLILRRTEREMFIDVYWSSCKVSVILVAFYETWIFLTDFRKKITNIRFNEYMFSWSRVDQCGRTDRITDRRTWRS